MSRSARWRKRLVSFFELTIVTAFFVLILVAVYWAYQGRGKTLELLFGFIRVYSVCSLVVFTAISICDLFDQLKSNKTNSSQSHDELNSPQRGARE